MKIPFAAAFLSLCLGLSSYSVAAQSVAANKPAKAKTAKVAKAKPAPAPSRKVRSVVVRKPVVRAAPTFGQAAGLHEAEDPLSLKSSVAYVLDQDTNEVLFSKNPQAVLPIASITKLMTALVVLDANQRLSEMLTVTMADVDRSRSSGTWLVTLTSLARSAALLWLRLDRPVGST